MTKRYKVFTKNEFEYKLRGLAWKVQSDILDVTNDLIRNNIQVYEHVYLIRTKRENVSILVYSSVDTRTGKTREKGSDAVRIVLTVKTDKGTRFHRHMKKHLRVNNLFDNIHDTLKAITKEVNKGVYSSENFIKIIDNFNKGLGSE